MERRGQLEIGIVTHNGHVFAAFGSSVNRSQLTGYTRHNDGSISLTRWDGSTMLSCRSGGRPKIPRLFGLICVPASEQPVHRRLRPGR